MTDGIFLMHIVDALRETIDFTNGVGMTEFFDSKLLIRAVMSSFEIAGESTKNLTMEFRDSHPEVKWRQMAGFRDVLIHGYFGIDETQLWKGAKEFAPEAISKIEQMVEYRQALADDAID
ncbi:MAG: DUF86 domain-containing protein [Kiritimatiellae bacterium]|nr:DUF86 domain-containing protein [Kiritimatiellia bacterium]